MRKTVFAGILLGLCTIASLVAQAGDVLALKPDHPQTYVVKKGDTLWGISGMYLQNPWLWPEIWHVNPQIDNPHLIYPGDQLNLVYIDGQPKLVVKRGLDVKLDPRVRLSDLQGAIPTIPLESINAFLSKSRVVDGETLKGAPYVLAGKDGHIVVGAGDEIYARGTFAAEGDSYGIYRPGDAYIDPDTQELLGYRAHSIATAKKVAVEGEVATLALNQTSEEVRRSDRLLAEEDRQLDANFFPSAAPVEANGYIIAVEGGVSQIGAMDVVVINKGERDQLVVGNVMEIFRAGEVVRDEVAKDLVRVPDTKAGLLMVFRTFDKVSYALVLRASKPLAVMDKVKAP